MVDGVGLPFITESWNLFGFQDSREWVRGNLSKKCKICLGAWASLLSQGLLEHVYDALWESLISFPSRYPKLLKFTRACPNTINSLAVILSPWLLVACACLLVHDETWMNQAGIRGFVQPISQAILLDSWKIDRQEPNRRHWAWWHRELS